MGLRSPQEMNVRQLEAQGTTRLQGQGVQPISGQFLNTLSANADAREKLRQEQERLRLEYLKDTLETEDENDRVQAQAKVAASEGMNAVTEAENQRKWLEERSRKRFDALPEEIRLRLGNIPAETVTKYNKFSIPYQAQQGRKLRETALKERSAARINEAVENSADPEAFVNALDGLASDSARFVRMQYGEDPEALVPGTDIKVGELQKEIIRSTQSEAIRRAVEAQVSAGQVGKARELLSSWKEQIKPGDEAKAMQSITKAEVSGMTDTASTIMRAAEKEYPGDGEKQLQYIIANSPNDAIRRQTITMNNARLAAEQKAKDQADEKLVSELAKSALVEPVDVVMAKARNLPLAKQQALLNFMEKRAKGLPVITNQDEYKRMVDVFKTGSVEEIKALNMQALRMTISEKDLAPYEARQRALFQADTDAAMKARASTDRIADDIVEKYAFANGLSSDEQLLKLQKIVMERHRELLDNNPRMTIQELRTQLLSDLNERGIKKAADPKWYLPSFMEGEKNDVADTLSPDSGKSPAEPSDPENFIHPSHYEAAREYAKRNKINMTEADIEAYLQRKKKSNPDFYSKPR